MSELDRISAPFTQEQVRALNLFQDDYKKHHPFCCFGEAKRDHPVEARLVATVRGWICPYCDYTQNWAHQHMLDYGLKVIEKHNNLTKEQERQVLEHLASIRAAKALDAGEARK
jgi:glutaredoxin